MTQTQILMKLVAFIALVSFVLVILAMDENLKEFEPTRTGYEELQNELEDNPVDDLRSESDVATPTEAVEAEITFGPWWDVFNNAAAVAQATMAIAQAIWSGILFAGAVITSFAKTGLILLELMATIVTFTIPGIPFEVQALFWSISFSTWSGIFYIAFRAIRGGG